MTNTRFLAYVPQIDSLLAGVNYEMALAEELSFTNELAQYPLEDPQRASLIDHFHEQPLEINLTIAVSTEMLKSDSTRTVNTDGTAYNPFVSSASGSEDIVVTAVRQRGTSRLQGMLDWIEKTRRMQAVSTDNFLSVHTGLRIYRNMAIQSCTVTRDPETPNTMQVELSLIEVRLAVPPYQLVGKEWKMEANQGPRSSKNTVLVEDTDRTITEGMTFGSRIRSTQASIKDAARADILSGFKTALLRFTVAQAQRLTGLPLVTVDARFNRKTF